VIDRLQHRFGQTSVIPVQSCTASYGILCNELYDSKKHPKQILVKNQVDGKRYAKSQIDWFIKRGQRLQQNGVITRRYSRLVSPKNLEIPWTFTIVSELSADVLPAWLDTSDAAADAEVICRVVSDSCLSAANPAATQKRGLLSKKVKFVKVEYEVTAVVEPGKLGFKIRIIGEPENESELLKVQWLDNQVIEDGAKDSGEEGLIRATLT